MFESSKDILFVALAACIAVFTFFLCWALYYIVMMLKRAHVVVKEVSDLISSLKEKLNRVEKLFDAIEEKIKHSASYLPLVFKGITEVLEYFKKKKEDKREKRQKRKSTQDK